MSVWNVEMIPDNGDVKPLIHGFVVTAILVGLAHLMSVAFPEFRSPTPILLLGVAYTAYVGGIGPGLLAAVIVLLYGLFFFSSDGFLQYQREGAIKLFLLAIAAPVIGATIGLLKYRADRLTETALERQRDYSATLLESMQDGLVAHDSDGRIVEVNGSFCRMTGYDRQELMGRKPPYPFWSADKVSDNLGVYQRYMAGEKGEFEVMFQRKSGEEFPVLLTASSVTQGEADIPLRMKTVKDVTERKAAERRLRIQYEIARLLADSHSVTDVGAGVLKMVCQAMHWTFGAVWLVDPETGLFRCSQTYREDGHEPMEFEQVTRSRTFRRGEGLPGRVLETGESVWISDVLTDANFPRAAAAAKASLHSAIAFPIRVDREVIGVIEFFDQKVQPPDEGLLQMMTAVGSQIGQFIQRRRSDDNLRHRAVELELTARALRKSNQELDQFAYIASHDLKAPLRGIANLSTWIEEDMGGKFTAEASQQMELLRGRVRRMEALIDGILEYSRIGRYAGTVEQTDVAMLLADVIDMVDPPAGFVVETEPGMPVLMTDKLRLQQVFLNLISNAIKHHNRPDGHVWVKARDDGEMIEFSVRDDGPGIAPEYHEKIFIIFQTLTPRDALESTGVGLSVVKKIVEHYGGTIRLESRAGEGATFIFTWPRTIAKGD